MKTRTRIFNAAVLILTILSLINIGSFRWPAPGFDVIITFILFLVCMAIILDGADQDMYENGKDYFRGYF